MYVSFPGSALIVTDVAPPVTGTVLRRPSHANTRTDVTPSGMPITTRSCVSVALVQLHGSDARAQSESTVVRVCSLNDSKQEESPFDHVYPRCYFF
jgi:hypothetical protein